MKEENKKCYRTMLLTSTLILGVARIRPVGSFSHLSSLKWHVSRLIEIIINSWLLTRKADVYVSLLRRRKGIFFYFSRYYGIFHETRLIWKSWLSHGSWLMITDVSLMYDISLMKMWYSFEYLWSPTYGGDTRKRVERDMILIYFFVSV